MATNQQQVLEFWNNGTHLGPQHIRHPVLVHKHPVTLVHKQLVIRVHHSIASQISHSGLRTMMIAKYTMLWI